MSVVRLEERDVATSTWRFRHAHGGYSLFKARKHAMNARFCKVLNKHLNGLTRPYVAVELRVQRFAKKLGLWIITRVSSGNVEFYRILEPSSSCARMMSLKAWSRKPLLMYPTCDAKDYGL